MPARELIRDLPTEERPRERLLSQGPEALSDAELLAVLLRTGTRGKSALSLATDLLRELDGLAGLLSAKAPELRRDGLGEAKAATLLASLELARRVARCGLPDRKPMARPAEVASYVGMRYGHQDQEVVGALYLDARECLVAEQEIYRGTLRRAAVETREILREGLLRGATAMVLFHTHPSGDPSPSHHDMLFTRELDRAGEVVGIELVDHLIVARGGAWTSLRQRGAW